MTAFLPAKYERAVIAANTSSILDIVSVAFDKVDLSSFPSFLKARIINNKATEMAKIPTPALAALFPANLLATIIRANIPSIATIEPRLLFILLESISAMSSIAPISIFKPIIIAIKPTAELNLTPLLALEITPSATTSTSKATIDLPRLLKLALSMLFNTPTNIRSANAIVIKVNAPFESFGATLPSTPATVASPTAIVPSIRTLFQALSPSKLSIAFIHLTRISNDTDKANNAVPTFPKSPNFSIKLTANAKADKDAMRTAKAPIDDHNLD